MACVVRICGHDDIIIIKHYHLTLQLLRLMQRTVPSSISDDVTQLIIRHTHQGRENPNLKLIF